MADRCFALVFGLFLGLCIWKFGNPVILDHKIAKPSTFDEFLNFAWPVHWTYGLLLSLVIVGGGLMVRSARGWRQSTWLWLLPLVWMGWQFMAAFKTVDANLTIPTLWQFSGCVVCYFLGAWLLSNRTLLNYLFVGLFAAFAFCLVRAVDQRLYEFPMNHQMLVEGQQCGWTNFPPQRVLEMRQDAVIIKTNGLEVANPVLLAKFEKGRVLGTLVYPNALAGLILLLFPVSLAYAVSRSHQMKWVIRSMMIALVASVGLAALYWSGSKLGWLIAMGMGGLYLFQFKWSGKIKVIAIALVLILGVGVFWVRFHHYFASGARSAGARLDYWHAAVQIALKHPMVGSGPGTFQRPYAEIKDPESEMARLVHNDYLEQFCDSGLIGGLAYLAWVFLALRVASQTYIGRLSSVLGGWAFQNAKPSGSAPQTDDYLDSAGGDPIGLAITLGLLGWFVHALGEFGLYIPATAWTAFTLLGVVTGRYGNGIDKNIQNSRIHP